MVKIQIKGATSRPRLKEVHDLVGQNRLYRQGTDASLYLDLRDRSEADLLATSLNLIPGVRARILPDG